MKPYRDDVLYYSSYLLLQLSRLRIEKEQWRDALVVRGPGGRFASSKGLNDEATNTATRSEASVLLRQCSQILEKPNSLINVIGEKLFATEQPTQFQQSLANEFSKKRTYPSPKTILSAEEMITEACIEAEQATSKKDAAKAMRKAFEGGISFTKNIISQISDDNSAPPLPASDSIQGQLQQLRDQLSSWVKKRNDNVSQTIEKIKTLASNHLPLLAIQSTNLSPSLNTTNFSDPPTSVLVSPPIPEIDQDLKKEGVNDKTLLIVGAALLIAALAGSVAIHNINSRTLSAVEREVAENNFEQLITPPDIPVSQPDIPVSQPDIPVSQPDIPVSQPDIPVSQPDIPVSQPDIPTSFSDTIETKVEDILRQYYQWDGRKTVNQTLKEDIRKGIEAGKKRTAKLDRKSAAPRKDLPEDVVYDNMTQGNKTVFETLKFNIDDILDIKLTISGGTETTAKDVIFTSNNDLRINSKIPAETRNKAAKRITKVFEAYVSQQPDGTRLTCSAFPDAAKANRQRAYTLVGFSSPELAGGKMYGVVKNGRLYPTYSNGNLIQ